MAVGRISGPLLKDNLLRNGVNLAFETNLLYLDVVNGRVGINTITPDHELSVNGTTRTANLYATNQAIISEITVTGNTISSTNPTINLLPTGAAGVVYQGTLSVGSLRVSTNTISAVSGNTDVNITASGTGQIKLNSNTYVTGNLHATGTITSDGNIQLGDNTGDTVTFDGEVNSNIVPSQNNYYNLGQGGATPLRWNNVYSTNATITTVNATTVNTDDFQTSGLDITGNTISAKSPNTDINLVTDGSGTGIIIDNFKFSNNNITNTVTNAITNFNSTTTTISFTGSLSTGSVINFVGNIGSGLPGQPGNILTLTSEPSWPVGGSLTFDGSSSYVSMDIGITVQNSPYTVECFFYMTAGTSGALLGGSNNWALGLLINSLTGSNNISVVALNETTNDYSVGDIELNSWNHIAITRNADGEETVFFNGVRASNGTTTTNIGFVGLTNLIGQQDSANYFNGYITNSRWVVGSNVYDPTDLTITVPTTNIGIVTDAQLLLLSTTSNSLITDNAGIQVITNHGCSFNAHTPYAPGLPVLEAYQVISALNIIPGTYLVAGAGLSWTINNIQYYPNTPFTAQTSIMTVTSSPTGPLLENMTIQGEDVLPGTYITSYRSGTGDVGTYNVTPFQTVSEESLNAVISGYVKITGTYGIVIPNGSSNARPLNGYYELGMIRYNTDYQYVEVYNGTQWISVAGASSGVTSAQASDIALGIVLSLG